MGEFRMGPPAALLLELQRKFGINTFIETGTFKGKTAHWASAYFREVITIESSQRLHSDAIQRYGGISNIRFLLGTSCERLKEIVLTKKEPCVFWLDSHWCEGITEGETYQCPLIEEIDIINRSEFENYLLIDDARFFLSPPPPPNLPCQWPDISTVIGRLNSTASPRFIAIAEDVIIGVPMSAKSGVTQYCQILNATRLERRLKPIIQDLLQALGDPSKVVKKVLKRHSCF